MTQLISSKCDQFVPALSFATKNQLRVLGVIAGISKILADGEVPIFVVSTFDTDYILVPELKFTTAKNALENSGYYFE